MSLISEMFYMKYTIVFIIPKVCGMAMSFECKFGQNARCGHATKNSSYI